MDGGTDAIDAPISGENRGNLRLIYEENVGMYVAFTRTAACEVRMLDA